MDLFPGQAFCLMKSVTYNMDKHGRHMDINMDIHMDIDMDKHGHSGSESAEFPCH